jgi:uncharacterized protein (DUF2147 family)
MLQRIALAFVLCSIMLAGIPLKAFAEKDKIEGFWYNDEQTAKVQIYKAKDGKFWGKIVWLKEPTKNGKPRTDDKNPSEKLRSTPLLNLPILRGFTKEDDDTYSDGKIYDPKNGKTYSCTITYRSDAELGIRGYIGISMIGRTTTWKRAE